MTTQIMILRIQKTQNRSKVATYFSRSFIFKIVRLQINWASAKSLSSLSLSSRKLTSSILLARVRSQQRLPRHRNQAQTQIRRPRFQSFQTIARRGAIDLSSSRTNCLGSSNRLSRRKSWKIQPRRRNLRITRPSKMLTFLISESWRRLLRRCGHISIVLVRSRPQMETWLTMHAYGRRSARTPSYLVLKPARTKTMRWSSDSSAGEKIV